VNGHKSPPKCENLVAVATFQQLFPAWTTQYSDPDEIKPVSIDHWPTVACQIYRESVHVLVLQRLSDAYGF